MRVIVKIGSSLLTERSGRLAYEQVYRYARYVTAALDTGHEVAVVSSGAIAAGFEQLGFSERPSTVVGLQASAAVGQGMLMGAYADAFGKYGRRAAQVLLTRRDFSFRESYNNAYNALTFLLERQVVPIINENDVVSLRELSFGENDLLAALVAALVQADHLVVFTDAGGIYSADPRLQPKAQRYDHLDRITPEIWEQVSAAGSGRGTGGMQAKVRAARVALSLGVDMFIGCSECKEGEGLLPVLAGVGDGTYLAAGANRGLKRRMQWIAFHGEVRGQVEIDQGAVTALVERGKSLLAAGVVSVRGDFESGMVVEVMAPNGKSIGKGLVNYSAVELARVKGLSSTLAREQSSAAREEVIHRDDWVNLSEF